MAKIVVTDFKTTFEYLKALCKDAGTNITQVCRKKKIRRGNIQRWSEGDPKSIAVLRVMEQGIAEAKKSKVKIKSKSLRS